VSLDDRVSHLETEYREINRKLDSHAMLLDRIITLQEEQSGIMRDVVRLLGSVDDRLGRIEESLRPPGRNGGELRQ